MTLGPEPSERSQARGQPANGRPGSALAQPMRGRPGDPSDQSQAGIRGRTNEVRARAVDREAKWGQGPRPGTRGQFPGEPRLRGHH